LNSTDYFNTDKKEKEIAN